MGNQQYTLPPIDRSLEDFVFAFDITDFKSQYQRIEEKLKNKIDDCCVDKIEDISKEKCTCKTYKILKTELTKDKLYKLKCQYPQICFIWIYDKHPIKRSKSQEHIEKEDINILKHFDIFIDPYVNVRGEKGKVYERKLLPKIKKECKEQIKRHLKQLKEYFTTVENKEEVKPTKDDYYMYLAYKESQKSIELKRWVGAVIIDEKTEEEISKGYNQYPSEEQTGSLNSKGRKDEVIHAEVDAILNIINDIIKKEKEQKYKHLLNNPDLCLYTTTFPCEDCAKCIIKAGIKKVIYIEPYYKSKTEDFYTSFITLEKVEKEGKRLPFLTFEGIGPRLFLHWDVKEKAQNWQRKETSRIKGVKKKQGKQSSR